MGTSFTEYRGSGFWTRDAALETVLALLVVELEPVASGDATLESVLDVWTVQAVAGFNGFVSPDLDEHLAARPSLAAAVIAALKRIRERLPPGGIVEVGSPALARRADRVCEGHGWNTPGAAASWAGNVADALRDLVAGCLPEVPGAFWFVDGDGRHSRPVRRPSLSAAAACTGEVRLFNCPDEDGAPIDGQMWSNNSIKRTAFPRIEIRYEFADANPAGST